MTDEKLLWKLNNALAKRPDWPGAAAPGARGWLRGDYTSLYYRLGYRKLEMDEPARTIFEISSIEIKAAFQGQGIFTSLCQFIDKRHFGIYAENVHNPRLAASLLRRGFRPVPHLTTCYYRLKPPTEN